MSGLISIIKPIERKKKSEKRGIQTCDICGKKVEGYGHNPSPLIGEMCCKKCNDKVVLPTRIMVIQRRKQEKGEEDE